MLLTLGTTPLIESAFKGRLSETINATVEVPTAPGVDWVASALSSSVMAIFMPSR